MTKASWRKALYLLAGVAGMAIADDGRYAVTRIPPSLRENSDAVVRLRSIHFEVKDRQRAVQTVTEVVTIFKREQNGLGRWEQMYDEHITIEDIEGTVFDAEGNEVRTLDDDEISDYSAISGYSIYEDNRVMVASLQGPDLPYTVEYRYEIFYDGFLQWPSWVAQHDEYPVEHTEFEVVVSEDESLRFWCNIDTLPPTITTRGGLKTYRWEARNLPRLAREVTAQNLRDWTIIVRIAPREFEIDGARGDMSTWQAFGRWYFDLSRDRDQLPAQAHEQVRRIVASCATERQKVFALYRHLQSTTRYVSVQLGLGGWRPYDAAYVYERGYGDCKALTNYMKALLKSAGIRSYPVLIDPGNRRSPMIVEFPSNQFSHVILCIPSASDTMWLECTSQSFPADHLGGRNENLNALLVSEEGGTVIRTPASLSSENRLERMGLVELEQTGNAQARLHMAYSGCMRDEVHGALENRSPNEQQRWLIRSLDIPHGDLTYHEFSDLAARESQLSMMAELSLPRFATSTRSRLFFTPGAFDRVTWVLPDIQDLRSGIILSHYAFVTSDSIIYMIPSTYVVEAMPAVTRLETSFGSFHSSTEPAGDNLLLYRRRVEVRLPSVTADRYEECKHFFNSMVKADRSQVVLVRKALR